MLQPKVIKVDVTGNKLRFFGNIDLSFLGFRAIKKFAEYTSEICINNLLDLTQSARKSDWILNYTDEASYIRTRLLDEYKSILEAKKYKLMLNDQIDEEWDSKNFFEKKPLRNHQKRAILFGLQTKRCCLFLDMGLGKSAIGATFAQILYDNKLIKRGSVLIVAPKTLHGEENWDGEIDKFSNLSMVNLREDLDNINNPYADIFIMNSERFRIICMDKDGNYIKGNPLEKRGFECVIFDEATKLKTHNSKTRVCFKEISRNLKYCLLMSGLPAPNSIFQLWGLTSCIGNWLGDSYEAFEQRYGVSREIRPKVCKFFPRRNAEEEIKARLESISISMSQEEYLDLPEYFGPLDIELQMKSDHEKLYKEIIDEYSCVIKDKDNLEYEIFVDNETTARIKLLQILSGFICHIDEYKNKTLIPLDWNPKLDAILKHCRQDLEDPDNYIIIWTRFREEHKYLYTELSKHWLCAYGIGGMTDDEQSEQLQLWLKNKNCRIMLAHPGGFMYGHTWNKANFTYYSSAVDDNEQYSQSRKRNYRFGQTRNVTEKRFVLLDTIEKGIWQNIERKIKLDRFLKGLPIK